ncbi:MAG: hypothetical protein OXE52_01570 [Chloroflexi bacterium]|nr:hypothetical protein [Chloroflexota bacterium]
MVNFEVMKYQPAYKNAEKLPSNSDAWEKGSDGRQIGLLAQSLWRETSGLKRDRP